ncbi:hypothetical protein HKX48_006890 [Thoreauomyces humboldtii]|nr:hypothetical protein HKX48_006890 [Thoreauomyces humboldtii]
MVVSEATRGAMPGYKGDRRVEWQVEVAATLRESEEKTFTALEVLRDFWNDASPEELGFDEFVWCVFSDASMAPSSKGGPVTCEQRTVLSAFAERLARSAMTLSAFLADVRDWDAFRLLIRRRAGRLPVLTNHSKDRHREPPSVHVPRKKDARTHEEAVRMLSSESFFYVLAEKEAEWEAQRSVLEAALGASERKVQRIINSVAGALGGVIGEVPLNKSAKDTDTFVRASIDSIPKTTARFRLPPSITTVYKDTRWPNNNKDVDLGRKSSDKLNKKVSFDGNTLERDERRRAASLSRSHSASRSMDAPQVDTKIATTSVWRDLAEAIRSSEDSSLDVYMREGSPKQEFRSSSEDSTASYGHQLDPARAPRERSSESPPADQGFWDKMLAPSVSGESLYHQTNEVFINADRQARERGATHSTKHHRKAQTTRDPSRSSDRPLLRKSSWLSFVRPKRSFEQHQRTPLSPPVVSGTSNRNGQSHDMDEDGDFAVPDTFEKIGRKLFLRLKLSKSELK